MNNLTFGIISYEYKKLIGCCGGQNMGDWLQTYAMKTLMDYCEIENYKYISRNKLSDYNDEYTLIPINGVWHISEVYNAEKTKIPSEKIIPMFWSIHLYGQNIPDDLKALFLRYAPIGCRDTYTTDLLRKNGISAFTTGCVSALLDRRDDCISAMADEIIFIDTPASLERFIPHEIKSKAKYRTNIYNIPYKEGRNYTTKEEADEIYRYAMDNYNYYKNHAKLIVTSRLHIASPCMAMGIPVILVDNHNIDRRFSWIDKFIKPYYENDFGNINWDPSPVYYEDEKRFIKNLFRKRLSETYEKYNELCMLNSLYDDSRICHYVQYYMDQIDALNINRNEAIKFAIWGVREPVTSVINCIYSKYKNFEYIGAYDKNVDGEYEGKKIMKPEMIPQDPDILYILMTPKILDDTNFEKIRHNRYVIIR